eukprot:Nk52_evm16s1178 gene=Nk52_evmTU16s1178
MGFGSLRERYALYKRHTIAFTSWAEENTPLCVKKKATDQLPESMAKRFRTRLSASSRNNDNNNKSNYSQRGKNRQQHGKAKKKNQKGKKSSPGKKYRSHPRSPGSGKSVFVEGSGEEEEAEGGERRGGEGEPRLGGEEEEVEEMCNNVWSAAYLERVCMALVGAGAILPDEVYLHLKLAIENRAYVAGIYAGMDFHAAAAGGGLGLEARQTRVDGEAEGILRGEKKKVGGSGSKSQIPLESEVKLSNERHVYFLGLLRGILKKFRENYRAYRKKIAEMEGAAAEDNEKQMIDELNSNIFAVLAGDKKKGGKEEDGEEEEEDAEGSDVGEYHADSVGEANGVVAGGKSFQEISRLHSLGRAKEKRCEELILFIAEDLPKALRLVEDCWKKCSDTMREESKRPSSHPLVIAAAMTLFSLQKMKSDVLEICERTGISDYALFAFIEWYVKLYDPAHPTLPDSAQLNESLYLLRFLLFIELEISTHLRSDTGTPRRTPTEVHSSAMSSKAISPNLNMEAFKSTLNQASDFEQSRLAFGTLFENVKLWKNIGELPLMDDFLLQPSFKEFFQYIQSPEETGGQMSFCAALSATCAFLSFSSMRNTNELCSCNGRTSMFISNINRSLFNLRKKKFHTSMNEASENQFHVGKKVVNGVYQMMEDIFFVSKVFLKGGAEGSLYKSYEYFPFIGGTLIIDLTNAILRHGSFYMMQNEDHMTIVSLYKGMEFLGWMEKKCELMERFYELFKHQMYIGGGLEAPGHSVSYYDIVSRCNGVFKGHYHPKLDRKQQMDPVRHTCMYALFGKVWVGKRDLSFIANLKTHKEEAMKSKNNVLQSSGLAERLHGGLNSLSSQLESAKKCVERELDSLRFGLNLISCYDLFCDLYEKIEELSEGYEKEFEAIIRANASKFANISGRELGDVGSYCLLALNFSEHKNLGSFIAKLRHLFNQITHEREAKEEWILFD